MAASLSDDELKERAGEDVTAYVQELRVQVEIHKARADAAVINAEQACSLIEQKFLSLTEQYGQLEHEKQQISVTLERRAGELGQAQGKAHKLELDAIKHSSDLERIGFELGEVRKSKRDLLGVVEQKNAELDEKNASIRLLLEKIVSLTDERSILEGRLREHDVEVARSHSSQARLQQEKELLEQHNSWLNEELSSKLKNLLYERQASAELEADLQSKLTQAEKVAREATEAQQKSKERIGELEAKLLQTREELRYANEQAVLQEDHLTAEIATATKLADLYKQSSDDWSKKSNELEGVVKAIETHLNQVESDYRDKLDKEIQAREAATKETAELKEKLDKAVADRKSEKEKNDDAFALPSVPKKIESLDTQFSTELQGEGAMLPSVAVVGISGTALAAALLREGWSLATMYAKYQEAVDAWRHETHERKNSQALLERVLHEIELKAEFILDEREEHERLIESYRKMEEKLHYSMGDQSTLENAIKDLKADLRKKEREMKGAQKEISDLQIQVAGLLKECADVKQKYEAGEWQQDGDALLYLSPPEPDSSATDVVISDKLVSFKDIKGMVEQNSALRILVRELAHESEQKETDLKEVYAAELNRRAESAANKVSEVLSQYKEKEEIMEALQGTVAMFKRLYEEALRSRYTSQDQLTLQAAFTSPGDDEKDYSRLLHSSKEEIRAVRDEAVTRIKSLEEELAKTKSELTNYRIERARVDAEVAIAREQMFSLTQEAESRRKEMDSVLLRNMEFSQTITNYQQRLRDSSQRLHAAEELANKLKLEASILEKEKELLASAEKRASGEVASLSDRAHRLQASLDTFQSIEETRESSRAAEIKKLQDDSNRMQNEWTEARKELEVERRHSRDLTNMRDKAVQEATDRVEAVSKELADALKAMSVAETRAQVAEQRCTELEANLKKAEDKIVMALTGGKRGDAGDKTSAEIDAEILSNLQETREELEQVKEDLVAAKGHTEQYKRIAEANEEALKQLEAAHNRYKEDVDHMKEVMQAEITKLKEQIVVLESNINEKDTVIAVKTEEVEDAQSSARKEITAVSETLAAAQVSLQENDVRIEALKKEVDKYRHQWRDSQHNYERQIVLQADTIRELTTASDRLAKLEEEEGALRVQAETAESQLASLQVSWAMEKSSLESMKSDAEKKWKDLDQQNRLLLDRLEAVHITVAENNRKASSEPGSAEAADNKEESDLQNVIRYLRRSKETADTEVSLLKQERLRLQRQLEAALRASEEAQSTLRREQENSRASLYSDEEFKSLQAQVREINLLRESNSQLREENRRNFEDSRESREKVRHAHAELEPVQLHLREREVELEAAGKELEIQRVETQRWQNRVSQLLEKYKAIDVEDYQQVKIELAQVQDRLKINQEELDAVKPEAEASKKALEEVRTVLAKLQSDINEKESKLTDLEKKLQDAEATAKQDLDKFKRHAQFSRRKIETLTKENESLKQNEAPKQNEDPKATLGKRASEARQEAARQEATFRQEVARQEANLRQEAATRLEQVQKESENSLKEKETRIQVLEKTVEREREAVRKVNTLRQRDQKTFYDVAQKAVQEKKRFLDELEAFKKEKLQQLEKPGNVGTDAETSSTKPEIEERAVTYQAAVNAISEVAASVLEQIGQPTSIASIAVVPAVPPAASAPLPPPVVQPTTAVNVAETVPPPTAEAIPPLAELLQPGASGPPSTAVVPPPSAGAPVTGGAASGQGTVSATIGISATPSVATIVSTPAPPVRSVARPAASNVPHPPSRPLRQVPPPVAPVPDQREREMAQLRAQIQEKERATSVSQVKKSARRLIRPRIGPEVVAEQGDTALEVPSDATETGMEPEEPAKLATASSDLAELASASAAQVTVVTAPITSPAEPSVIPVVTVSISTTAAEQPPSGPRKRPAVSTEPPSVAEEAPIEPAKSDIAPPQKRPRPVELQSEETPQEILPVSTAVPLAVSSQGETSTSHGMNQDNQAAGQDAPATDVREVPIAAAQDIVTPSLPSDNERERPVTETADAPPQKRPRFARPASLGAGKDGVSHDETVDDKVEPETEDIVHREVDVVKETVKGEAESSGQAIPVIEGMVEEQKVDVPSRNDPAAAVQEGEPQLNLDLASVAVGPVEEDLMRQVAGMVGVGETLEITQIVTEVVEMIVEQPIASLQDDIPTPLNQVTVVNEVTEVAATLPSEQDTAMGDAGIQREIDLNTEATAGAEEIPVIEDRLEDGEIPDNAFLADAIPTSEPAAAAGPVEPMEAAVEPPEKPAEEEKSAAAPDAVPAVPTAEHPVGEVIPAEMQVPPAGEAVALASVTSEMQMPMGTSEATVNAPTPDSVTQEQTSVEEQPKPESSVASTRQSVKSTDGATNTNTTIHLADRARERAALRRGSSNPQGPATRGRGRAARGGSRRAPGASRGGRVISTGVRGRGQAGGTREGSPDGGRPPQQGGTGTSGQPDQAEMSAAPNPPQPREGED